MTLPVKVMQVKCHLTWLAKFLEQSSGQDNSKLYCFIGKPTEDEDMISTIDLHDLENIRSEQEGNLEKNCNDEYPLYVDFLSLQLSKCAKCLYTERFEIALVHLNKAQKWLEKLTGEHARLLNVMQYSVDCLSWCLAQMHPQTTYTDQRVITVEKLKECWKDLQSNRKCQAVIVYLKGRLAINVLSYNVAHQRKLVEKILELDSEYHIWWHFAYVTTHRIRIVYQGVQHDTRTSATSQLEINFCRQAYSLAPELFISKMDQANMLFSCLKETLNPNRFIPSDTSALENVEETHAQCLELYNDCLKVAEKLGMTTFVENLMSRKAELLLHLTNHTASHNQGWAILQESVRRFPESAFLHLCIGKIYHYGITTNDGNSYFIDIHKARDHFKTALHLRKWNTYTCMKNYMKLFPSLPGPQPAKEALDLLIQYEPLMTSDFKRAQIRLWRGWLHFLYNPEELIDYKRVACLQWVEVLSEYPDQREYALNFICKTGLRFFRRHDKWFLGQFLEQLKREVQNLKRDTMAIAEQKIDFIHAVELLLRETEVQQREVESVRTNELTWRGGRNMVIVPETDRNVSWRELRQHSNPTSLADSDTNWRAGK